jgi:hypothetical protein
MTAVSKNGNESEVGAHENRNGKPFLLSSFKIFSKAWKKDWKIFQALENAGRSQQEQESP